MSSIVMTASAGALSLAGIQPAAPPGLLVPTSLGQFVVNTATNQVAYTLTAELARGDGLRARICGFAPRMWDADPLCELTNGSGVWSYSESDEANILAGLAYVEVMSNGAGVALARGQLEPPVKPGAHFPAAPETSRILGTCERTLTMFGLFDRVTVAMEPAIVTIIRSPIGRTSDGRQRVQLDFRAECDGGTVPGLARVGIEVVPQGGIVESHHPHSDFPATMTMSLRMRYLTPLGKFITDTETYSAERIDEFPPFGVELFPAGTCVRVLEEQSGRHVGDEYLGPLVGLFHLSAPTVPARIPARSRTR